MEEFWESEVLRAGEEGAQGWAAWVSSGRQQQPPSFSSKSSSDPTDLDPYRQWAARESEADLKEVVPTRSTQESQEDDPYSTVLFSDIRPFLVDLQSPHSKNAFRLTWLSFLGLHIPGFSESLSGTSQVNWDDRWNHGHLCHSSYLDALFPSDAGRPHLATDAAAGVIVGREKEYASGFGPVRSWGNGVFGPLAAGIGASKGKGNAGIWDAKDIDGLNEKFVRSIFAQLRYEGDVPEWDTLALAFEAAISIKR